MRNLLRLLIAAALAAPALALAQASVQVRVALPVVLPQLVVVSPGVQVVPDVDEEVFYCNGWYWVRQDGGWYRSHSHRHGWRFVQPERVPRRLVGFAPGQYRRWHPPPPAPRPARYRPAPARYAPPPPAPARSSGDVRGARDQAVAPQQRGHGGDGHDHGDRHDHDRN